MFYYLLPLIAIALVFGYSYMQRKNINARVAAGEGPQMFHDTWAGNFEGLQPGEMIISLWLGTEFKAESTVDKVAGVAKNLATGLVGYESYTPNVQFIRTSLDRVLVAREYSEGGNRGYYKQLLALPPGTRAFDAAAVGVATGNPPTNPHNPMKPYQFVRIGGADGQTYDAWLLNEAMAVDGHAIPLQAALTQPPARPVLPQPAA